MKLITVDNKTSILLSTGKRRGGFYHEAILFDYGKSVGNYRANYVNRTWESFTYENVIRTILEVYADEYGIDGFKVLNLAKNI